MKKQDKTERPGHRPVYDNSECKACAHDSCAADHVALERLARHVKTETTEAFR